MNDLSRHNMMTIKEITDVLNIPEQTLRNYIRKLYPNLMKKGVTTYLNEEQIINIKQFIDSMNLHTDNESYNDIQKGKDYFERRYNEERLSHTETKRQNECYRQEIVEYQEEIAIMHPKAVVYDQISGSLDAARIQDASKSLNIPYFGPNHLYAFMREIGWIYKSNNRNTPYQKYINMGYFSFQKSSWIDKNGITHIYDNILITQKGIMKIADLLLQKGIVPTERRDI
jgi:phage antirepressor YoqD-like protein